MLPEKITIGVFDSGFGGLTVLRALLPLIPGAHYIYLGDTARLPYGSKSRETIARYAVSSAKFLHEQGADLLVIACNTAAALALEDIQQALPIPVIGVIQPGAHAAASLTATKSDAPEPALSLSKGLDSETWVKAPQISLKDNHVLVFATTATVQSHAYTDALNAIGLQSYEKACPLLVPLVEEGWTNHPVTDEVLRIYLTEALAAAPETTTLLLGCTHYPLLEPAIRRTLASIGHPLALIDSAHATAQATAALVAEHFPPSSRAAQPTCTFYATDSVEKFQRLGSAFLGQPVAEVRLIDLGG
jgi:glutamate racemase